MAKKKKSRGDGERTGGYCGYVRSIGGSTKAAVETAVVTLAISRRNRLLHPSRPASCYDIICDMISSAM
jgi:hypothetical protein